MPLTFPTLSFGTVCLYPLSRTVQSRTRVLRMADDGEKRWMDGPPLNGFALTYSSLSWTDVQALSTFFQQVKGSFDPTWTFPLTAPLAASYTNMQFTDDVFSYTRGVNNRYSVSFRIKQTKQSETIDSLPGFPATRQAPYVEGVVYENVRNEMANGLSFAWANRTTPRMQFTLNLPQINETELAAFLTHFIAAGGRWKSFSFTSPNDAVARTVRYNQDQLEARYNGLRSCALTVQLVQVAA